MTTIESGRADTRQTILLSAMQLFAENGLEGVSLRTISAHSGTRNSAAAHYHFGSRLGLIEAIVQHITEALHPQFDEGLCRLAQLPEPSVRQIIRVAFTPYLMLGAQPQWGRWAIRFMAHLHTDNTPEIQAILNQHFRLDLERLDELLHQALPLIPRPQLRLRMAFSMTNLIHGTAENELLRNTPFGNLRPASDEALLEVFLDYIEGGLCAAATLPSLG